MARVFSAVNITDPEILNRLEELRNTLDLGFKPVSREKMHLTLQFFSDVSEDEVEEIEAAMKSLDIKPFKLKISGIGVFPSKDYMRVLWAGVRSEKIHELKKQVSNHSVPENNNHDFHPHITLLRVENILEEEKNKLRRVLKEFEDEEIGEVTVDSVSLFETVLSPEGSKYKKIYEAKL